MKTTTFFRIVLATAVIVSTSNFVYAQRHQADNNRNEKNSTSRNQQNVKTTSRNQDNVRDTKTDRHYQSGKQENYGNAATYNSRNDNKHSSGNHDNRDKHKSNNEYSPNWGDRAHNDNHAYHKHNGNHCQNQVAYYHRLPAERYNRYVVNGIDYYHCDGRFFRFHANYGYVQVDCPYVVVDALPHNYHVRYMDGQRMVFWGGYYYLPLAYGWMMVPEPASPQFSLNIYIGK
ncbi:MAG: hypothetical protein QM786_08980 [Breznakibacter sp.]